MEEKRIAYLDVLRVFSIFCMILLHVSAENYTSIDVTSFHWQVLNIYGSAVRFCVPVFVMISGVVFLNPSKNIAVKTLFSKRILRLVTAFIFWSVVYAVFSAVFIKSSTDGTIKHFIGRVLGGHYHQWFIFMIVGLYLIIPLIRNITADKKQAEYFLILSFIFALVLPAIQLIPMKELTDVIAIFKRANFNFVIGFPVYFVGGHYFATYTVSKRTKRIIYLLGILSLLFTIIATSVLSVYKSKAISALYDYLLPTTAFVALSVFLFFKNAVSKLKLSGKHMEMLLLFSKCSFGMYLVHVLFLESLKKFDFLTIIPNAIIAVPVVSIFIFFCSFGVTYCISKIPIMNKYIM